MHASPPARPRASRALLLATVALVACWFVGGIVLEHPVIGSIPWIPWQGWPPLDDLRILLDGISAASRGADLLHSSELFNYPPTWLLLHPTGLSGANTQLVGGVLGVLFLAVVTWNNWTVSVPAAAATSLCLVSPPVLTALERGNNDLVIFLLLALGGALTGGWFPRLVASVAVALASLLKLYPLVVFGLFESRRPKDWLLPAVVFAATIIILLGQREAVAHALRKTPASQVYSYGISVPAKRLAERGLLAERWQRLALTGGVAAAAIAAGVAGFVRGRRCASPEPDGAASPAFALALAGGAIFLATYFASASWLYRFVFLLWIIPALPWDSADPAARRFAQVIGVVCVVAFWSFATPARLGFLVNQASHVLLVGGVGFLFGLKPPFLLRHLSARVLRPAIP